MSLETCGRASFEKPQEEQLSPDLMNLFNKLNFQDPKAINRLKCLPKQVLEKLFPFFNKINIEHQDCMAAIQNKAKN